MEQIEKILVEIQRLKKELDGYTASEVLDYIESYINLIRREYSLPSNLDEAANKFAVLYDQGTCDGIAQECFKTGAEWMAEQGVSADSKVTTLAKRAWVTVINEKQLMQDVYDNFVSGEKVIVQIRKKQ